MAKTKEGITEEKTYLFIELLDDKSLELVNSLFNTRYTKQAVRNEVTVKRAEKEPGFWDKLMRKAPKGVRL